MNKDENHEEEHPPFMTEEEKHYAKKKRRRWLSSEEFEASPRKQYQGKAERPAVLEWPESDSEEKEDIKKR